MLGESFEMSKNILVLTHELRPKTETDFEY
jgi:hypothetical protein